MRYEDILCDANNLYAAYLASIKNSKWKDSTQKFMLNFLNYIFQIQDDLKNRTFENSRMDEFSLCERGKIRPITSLSTADRVVRHVLCDDVLTPKVFNKIIYDNGASIKGRGVSFSRKRFEVHLRKYYNEHGNEGYILFGDFRKFYDNIVHDIAKKQLLELVENDEFIEWLLGVIFKSFEIDVSYMSEEEYKSCMDEIFDKLKYREIVNKDKLVGSKFMTKSVNIGDQLSQIIGVYYPHRIDNYVKYVRSIKYYGRYMDDWYIISNSKEELHDIYENIKVIASELGLHLNDKKTRIVKVSGIYKFLQIKYSVLPNGRIVKRINPIRVTALRRKLKKLAVKVINGELEYEHVENMFKSWMGSFYKLLSKEQRRNLISLYEWLFKKRIEIVRNKMIISDRNND